MAKTTSPSMLSHLAGEVTTLARCIEIERRDGATFYFTSLDIDLTFTSHLGDSPADPHTYLALGGFLDSAISTDVNMTVNTMELTGLLNEDTDFNLSACRAGLFDAAAVRLMVVNWADLNTAPVKLMNGTLGEVTVYPSGAVMAELRSLKQLYQQNIGQIYSQTCRVDLGSPPCGVDLGPFTFTETVVAVTDTAHFTITNGNTAAVDTWYRQGVVTWQSGDNVGRSIEVKDWVQTGAHVSLYLPMHGAVVAGDVLKIYPGCSKILLTDANGCKVKFNNVVNFRGEPYVPGQDALAQTPVTATTPTVDNSPIFSPSGDPGGIPSSGGGGDGGGGPGDGGGGGGGGGDAGSGP